MSLTFYERKRRLAYTIAVFSVALLASGVALGLHVETYADPRAASAPEGIILSHLAARTGDEGPTSHIVRLDPDLRVRSRTRVNGAVTAVERRGDETRAYVSGRVSVLRGGRSVRMEALDPPWDVQDVAGDSRFGWANGAVVWNGPSREVAAATEPERVRAAAGGDAHTIVAWRERGASVVHTARVIGAGFSPDASFDVGDARHWDVARVDGRTVLVSYAVPDWSPLGFREPVTLRLQCCAACGRPPLPETVAFDDPLLLLGRQVTGLAVAPLAGDRLAVVVTRSGTVQAGAVSTRTWRPVPDDAWTPLGVAPVWTRVGAAIFPSVMLFCSLSLVFLGVTLLRERARLAFQHLRMKSVPGPRRADILQRGMAAVLDLVIVIPPFHLLAELTGASPAGPDVGLDDPAFPRMIVLWFGLRFAYGFLTEWTMHATPGKRLLGLRVTAGGGRGPGIAGAGLRNLLRPVDAGFPVTWVVGAAMILLSRRRRRLGDLAAGTEVVEDRG